MLKWRPRVLLALSILGILSTHPTCSTVSANEALRIAGMGGAFVGLYSTSGAIFGNPAGLTMVQDNNLSVALSAQDMDFESLTAAEGEQLNTRLSFKLGPSIYYSRTISGIGLSLGYLDDLNNRSSSFRVEKTGAEYVVDERKFISETDTVLQYDVSRDRGPVVSLGYPLNPQLTIGIRLKYRQQIIKEGTIHRPLLLTAVHGEEVNRNDATKLLPAIIDNLDTEDAIDRFRNGVDGHEDVIADLSGSGLDFDLGIQTKLSDLGNVSAGFMLDHLIQRRMVDPQPSRIRFGVGAMPRKWLVAAMDFQKALDSSGLGINLGWEIRHRWERWFSGGITVRSGFSHEPSGGADNRLSAGIGLALGNSHWDYAFVKPLDGSPIVDAAHMFSSTTRF